MGATRTRKMDPRIARPQAKLGPATRDGKDDLAAQLREELEYAKLEVAAEKVVAQLAELSPEKRENIRLILAGA